MFKKKNEKKNFVYVVKKKDVRAKTECVLFYCSSLASAIKIIEANSAMYNLWHLAERMRSGLCTYEALYAEEDGFEARKIAYRYEVWKEELL